MRAGVRSGAVRADITAKHTIVSTADSPICSARIHTPNVATNWRMIAVGTCCTRSSNCSMSHRRRSHHDAAGDCEEERRGHCARREAACRNGAYREPVDQECRRVIEQAFAFENRQDSMRRAQWAKHGRGGDGIRWRDDGAERDGRRPRHRRHQRAGDDGDSDGRRPTATTTRPVTGAQLSLRSLTDASNAASSSTGATNSANASSGGSVNGGAREKREQRTADRQENRIRRSDAACSSCQDYSGDEQGQQLLEFSHVTGRQ